MRGATRRVAAAWRTWIVALLAWVPLLAFGGTRVNADTKAYLYSDPAGLMVRAARAWDSSQFGGFVPHQGVGYLWPSGPFYWLAGSLGVPDWLAQRLWLGALFFAAALGVARLLARLDLSANAALAGGIAYMFSPYVLPYEARTSAMLLPWAGLGWLCLVAVRGATSRTWRWPALASLILVTVAQVNGAAIVLVLPAPALFVVDAWMRGARRSSTVFAARAAILGAATSAWWIAAVWLQSRHGADVLAYSETVESVASTSNAFEVFRGFGYWLNYVGLDSVPLTTAASEAIGSTVSVAASVIVPLCAVVALAVTRRRVARLGSWLVFVGLVLAVGTHPVGSSPLLFRLLARNPDSTFALALRSSTRAIPVMLVGISIGIAVVVDSPAWSRLAARLRRRDVDTFARRFAHLSAAALLATLVLAAPVRFTSGSVDDNLSFDGPPGEWSDSARSLEAATTPGSRILQVPGQEFGSYTWGHTNDPALPMVSSRPVLTRDLLPLGTPRFMDALLAVDDAVREGRLDPATLEVLGDVLSFGSVFLTGDTDTARYLTPSADQLVAANDLSPRLVDLAGPHRALVLRDGTGSPVVQRASTLFLAGDGKGIVDAAIAGLIGGATIRHVADLGDAELADGLSGSSGVLVTDTNAPYARHWRGSRDAIGFSEDTGGLVALLRRDVGDVRLPVFAPDRDADRTSFVQEGPVTARATSYGSPLSYHPEHRPYRAVDGDESTSWLVGTGFDPTDERLELSAVDEVDSLRLVQPADGNRRITRIAVSVDNGAWIAHDLDSRVSTIDLDAPGRAVRIRIVGVSPSPSGVVPSGVGFAEVDLGLGPTREVGFLPTRGVADLDPSVPLAVVLSRLVAPAHDPSRTDPETGFVRSWTVSGNRRVVVAVRIDSSRAADAPDTVDIVLDGRTVTLVRTSDAGSTTWLSTPIELGAGTHEIDTTTSVAVLDQVAVVEDSWSTSAGTFTPGKSTGSGTRRRADVAACPDGCWLVLREGHNTGWTATLDGRDLGDPAPVDGGSNGWWLPAGTTAGTVLFEFAPQRILAAGLAVTVLSSLLALVLVLRRRRDADVARDVVLGNASSVTSRTGAAVLAAVVVAVTVSPVWGAGVAVAMSFVRRRRLDAVVRATSVALLAAGVSRGLFALVRHRPDLDFDWPAFAERSHRMILTAVCLAALSTLLSRGDGEDASHGAALR